MLWEPGCLSFRCNICGQACVQKIEELAREVASCESCGSTVRWRSVIHVLSMELFGQSLALPDFPTRPDIVGVGLSDWGGYAIPLANKLSYTNTYYHTEPKLDITSANPALEGTLDFIISSDVFEHVAPPVSKAFENACKLLKPSGVLVLTVPYGQGNETVEHFPELYDYKIIERGDHYVLQNTTKDGVSQTFEDLVFHGGPGETLEMRMFSDSSLIETLKEAGFQSVRTCRLSEFNHGVFSVDNWSLPIAARRQNMPLTAEKVTPSDEALSMATLKRQDMRSEEAALPASPDQVTLSKQVGAYLEATPNPVPAAGDGPGTTTITWGTGDDSWGQVYVSMDGGQEKLFAEGAKGVEEAPWIFAGATYYKFDLYAGTDHTMLLSTVIVTRSNKPREPILEELIKELTRYADQEEHLADIAGPLTKIMRRYLYSPAYRRYFRLWEEQGFHLTPVHYYQPLPDTRTLTDDLWEKKSELAGIDMNDNVQLQLLQEAFPRFRAEYEQFPMDPPERPYEFYFNNGFFSGTDALVLYCMVRHFQPNFILEVGSGFSSRVSAQAALRNGDTKLTCIEPYPDAVLTNGFPGLTSLIPKKVQEVELSYFEELGPGDILFIDSSHVVKIGGDVNYLFLEVVPRLKPGVIVHVHDIFFPMEYRRDWVVDDFRFWSEQYLLQAFLAFNSTYEVLVCNSYLGHNHRAEMQATFPNSPWWGGGSFWMRRKANLWGWQKRS